MECQRYKVRLIAPQTLEQLEDSMVALAREKRKSLGLMFEEAEFEIGEKQRFVESQNERIKNIVEVLNDLIEYKVVLETADRIIHGIIEERRLTENHNTLDES